MKALPKLIREVVEPLMGSPRDYDPVLDLVGDANFVLLGEASHGTHEFYRERAQITKRLITEKGFNAVAVEADWPDAWRVNQFVRGESQEMDSVEALAGFTRFPQWMWRNADVLDFVGWLREHNEGESAPIAKCGFYGLDLYSLQASIEAVLGYLRERDTEAYARAKQRYECFDHFGGDMQTYAMATGHGLSFTCEKEVISELVELRRNAAEYMKRDGRVAADELFCAEQNALVVRNAEEYYRTMFERQVSSWNLRDTHMMETLVTLANHLAQAQGRAKVVVWAHNSHLGNARATDMGRRGELNLGQLVRERYGRQALLIGFTTYTGTVTAASEWHAPAERKSVRPALEESYEALFHDINCPRFWLEFEKHPNIAFQLRGSRLQRAIGVIYRPEAERASHYFYAQLPDQFDAVLHFDHTRAVEPLERTGVWKTGEVEETFPMGL
jgi:erythromycin esterase-like protein